MDDSSLIWIHRLKYNRFSGFLYLVGNSSCKIFQSFFTAASVILCIKFYTNVIRFAFVYYKTCQILKRIQCLSSFPIRIPISSPSKSTSRQPSVVLYFDVISTSPRSMDPNTSRRNTIALSSISLISSGSVMISTGLPCFGAFSVFSLLVSFGSLGCFSRACFSFGNLLLFLRFRQSSSSEFALSYRLCFYRFLLLYRFSVQIFLFF